MVLDILHYVPDDGCSAVTSLESRDIWSSCSQALCFVTVQHIVEKALRSVLSAVGALPGPSLDDLPTAGVSQPESGDGGSQLARRVLGYRGWTELCRQLVPPRRGGAFR